MEFRDAVKYLRNELGLTQVELAMELKINAVTVGRWENGKTLPTRYITSSLMEFARSKKASKECLDILSAAIVSAAKKKLEFPEEGLYTVEHSSLRQLIDGASFPIYVCDIQTDELLYLNRRACDMVEGEKSAIGKKCYEILMQRDSACEFCNKDELTADRFKSFEAYHPSDATTYHVQGRLTNWNGRQAHVRYILGSEVKPRLGLIEVKTFEHSSAVQQTQASEETSGKLFLQNINNEKSAEQLRTIFENINGGVSVVVYEDNDKVRLAYANERYYQLFGYTKDQLSTELKSSHDVIHPDDWDKVASAIANVKSTKQGATFRYRIVKRDKSIAYVRCTSSVTSIEGISGYVLISVLTDITSSVNTEQQAIISAKRLDAIMKNMKSAVTASLVKDDGTFEFLFTNDLYYEMLGYTKQQYEQEVANPFELVHTDDVQALRSAILAMKTIGEKRELVYRAITRDGNIKWINIRINTMEFPDAQGPVQLSVCSDVTDIVKAQQELAEHNKQITELLNDTPSGIAIIEVDPNDVPGTLRTTFYNDRFYSFSGYDRAEYASILKENEMSLVFEEDIPTLLSDTKTICTGDIGNCVDTLVRCHTKDGGFRWLLLTGQLMRKHENLCEVNIVMVDVTERQEAIERQRISEEMLRIAAETDKRAMIVYNAKDNSCRAESRTLFSASYGEIFENIPQSLIDKGIVAPESVDELCSLFARIQSGEKEIRAALLLQSDTRKFEWFECNASTIFDSNGVPDHAVLVFHNITEQRLKEAVFMKWQQSIKTRPPMSYTLLRCNISRDSILEEDSGSLLKITFPSDVMSFNNRAQLYVQECVYEQDREALLKLMNSDLLLVMFYRGEHCSSIDFRELKESSDVLWRRLTIETVEYPDSDDIQAFLLFEDIDEEKRKEITEKELAQSDPLTGTLNRSAFAEKVDQIISENPESNSALIMLDMDGFKQLNDTFGHAAGDQALQEVAAVLRSYSRDGDLICRLAGDEFMIWLRDVPYDAVIGKTALQMCEHIHKAYSQQVIISASIGIAVYPRDGCRYEELYHNADKALYKVKQSDKGHYAFFSDIEEQQTEQLADALRAVKPSDPLSKASNRRMLIVDDSEVNRLMLKNMFEEEFQIEMARNGADAMIRLRHFKTSISVVLLDLLMPEVDGFTVLRKIQDDAELRTIPVIVVTGDDRHSTILKAFELGAAECVTKPVDADIIHMRVLSAINKADSERLRAQNSYLMLQRNEEAKYRSVLASTATVVIEYDWRNHVFIYDNEISKHIAGNYNHRGLWQVFLSDMVAESSDVKTLQDMLITLASSKGITQDTKLVKLKTPKGIRHWFRVNIYKSENEYGLTEKMILTFNDVHEEVLANEKLLFQATRDELTGLYNRRGFLEKAAELIAAGEPGYYVMACIDVEKFQVINDQYGTEQGDEVLKHIASTVGDYIQDNKGIACRYSADKFAVLYPAKLQNSKGLEENHKAASSPICIRNPLRLRIGRCLVSDTSLPASALFDRAAMAEALAKQRYDTYVIDYDESMRSSILKEQQLVSSMVEALQKGEFEPWLQPQFNHATGALIGAEALVRWRRDGKIITPNEFIPVFEKNGFVYEVDRYIWRQICSLLRRWLDEGKSPLPISVNISRYDMFQENFVDELIALVEEYALPAELLRLEITESAFSADTSVITDIAGRLISAGFTVEIDDFGSGYSSLNTLKDVPASILKLDMRFFESTDNSVRGGNIVEAIVRMAKWLGMAIIAEGVEDKEQADYLKSIGCYYIQGYYYSKPLTVADYEKRMEECLYEHNLSRMEKLESLDSNLFWNPSSMETLIFNSYVGGACIFEYHNGKIELVRYNDQYLSELNGLFREDTDISKIDIVELIDNKSKAILDEALQEALIAGKEVSTEIALTKGDQTEYIQQTFRVIAKTTDRTLYYCVIQNLTERRRLERERTENAERLSIIMSNVNGGVSALEINDDGTSHLVFSNDKYYELYGYYSDEPGVKELDPLSFIIPQDFPDVMAKVKRLKTDGNPIVIDYGITKKDGSRAQIRANASLMTMEGYGPIITSVLTDVTEQKALEEQLSAVVDNINSGVIATYLSNDKLQYIFTNDKYYEILGYTRKEYNEQVRSILEFIHPDDRSRVEKLVTQYIQTKIPYTIEFRIVRRSGAIRHILCSANFMEFFGIKEPVQLAVLNDVTLIREAQQKEQSLTRQLKTIITNIHGGVTATVFHDKNNIELAFANDGFYELFGYTKEQLKTELDNTLELIIPEDRDKTIADIEHIMRERGSSTIEYRSRRRDGRIISVQTTHSVISLKNVGDNALLAVSTDITALRHAEEESRKSSDRLRAVMNSMINGMTAVTIIDGHVQFIFANNRYYQLHGVEKGSDDTDTLRSAMAMIHPDDRKSVQEKVLNTTDIGQRVETEYRILLPKNEIRYIKMEINVVKLMDFDAPVHVTIYTDITEERKADKNLRFLNKAAGEILAQPDSERAITNTLKRLLDHFAGERAYIFELNDIQQTSANTYELCAAGVTPQKDNLKNVSYTAQQYWFDSLRDNGFITISDTSAMDEQNADMQKLLLAQSIRSIIVAPLWRDGKLIGYIGIDNPAKALDQVNQLIALSDYIAVLLTRRDLIKDVMYERQKAQQLMDDTPGGFVRLELTQLDKPKIITVNDGFCKMLNMTKEEVMNSYSENVYACLSDEDAAAAMGEITQACSCGDSYTGTFLMKKKDGELFWVMLFGRFIHTKMGKLYLNGYFTDITAQRSIEQLQSELLENLPSGAALYEFDGEKLRTIHINKHYWQLVDRPILTDEEVSVFGAFHPEDRAMLIDELKSAIRQGRNASCIARILCGDNTYKHFSVISNNVQGNNGKYLLYVTFTLITDEEMAIQKMLPVALSTIVSNTDDMSYVKDKELRYICVSNSVALMAGAQSPRDLIGKTAGEVFDPAFAEKFDADDRHIIETGKPVVRALEHIPTKDGSVCLARTTKFPILDATGNTIGVYCISHDITAQKEKESQLALLTDTIPGGLAAYSVSKEGFTTLYFNDGYYDYSGYTREEYIALTDKEPLALMLEEDRQNLLGMLRHFSDKKEDGMTASCAYRCRTKSGGIRWMSLKAVLSQVSEEAYVLNVVQLDITERVDAQKRQIELLDNLPFGAAMYEYDGKSLAALHINKQYALLVSRKVDYTAKDYNPANAIHPDDRILAFNEIRAAVDEGRNAVCDIRILCERDEYRYFHLDASIVPAEDCKYTLYVAYAPITDKELELKTTSERLKLLSNSIPGGIATFRCMPGNIELIYYNDGICNLTGYSREEFNSSSISVLGLIFDEDKPIIKEQIELLISGRETLDYSVRIHTKDGGFKWIECMSSVMLREKENIFIVSAVLTDVTEHMQERERLKVSEELNRLAIDQSGKIIARYDVINRMLTLPYTLPDIFDIPSVLENVPEEQVRLGRISPDTKGAYCGVFERIQRGVPSGEAVYQQNSTLGWRWLKSQFTTIFDSYNKPVSAVITFEDITEMRDKEAIYARWQNALAERSENSYTLVRCNISNPTILDSWEGNLLRLRFTDAQQSFNSRTVEYADRFVYVEDRNILRTFLNSDTMLAEYYRGHRNDSIEYREQNEDGTIRWLRLTVDLVEYPDSTDVEAYLMFEDINEQKHTELLTIRRAETDPLTGVLNRIAFIERVNQLIKIFGSSMINALFILDIDGFKQVNDVFGHGVGDQILIDFSNALTRFCRKDDLIGRLGGDEFFVFLSDIESARTAAKTAQRICDMTRKTLSADIHISTSIGISLSPQNGNDFDMLYKAADEALYRTKKSGKDGYAFSFGSPVINAVSKGESSSLPIVEATKAERKSRRILIVDDNKMALDILEEILKDDYFIEKATDGESALKMLHHYGTAISVVLLDLLMPGMSGFELLDKMQQDERTNTIPVIVVSSDENRETALKVIRAGASDLITKPVDADILRIRVESAVSKSENERLRAQNSYLAIRTTEINSYRTALERTGMMLITLNINSNQFSYSLNIPKKLAGKYDDRPLWSILLSDNVTDEQTAEKMQKLTEEIENDRERDQGSIKVRLKTISGLSNIFELNIYKELDEYGLPLNLLMTLNEVVQAHRNS